MIKLSTLGFRIYRSRSLLTVVGIAVGIGALVSVIGLSSSSKASVLSEIDSLGTNLLVVGPGESISGRQVPLPDLAVERIERMSPVESVASLSFYDDLTVTRSAVDDKNYAVRVVGVEANLFATVRSPLQEGRFLDAATSKFEVCVLGLDAARQLGVTGIGRRLWLDGETCHIVGILGPVTLAPALNTAVLVGQEFASRLSDGTGNTTDLVFVRVNPNEVETVAKVLASAANPVTPSAAAVQRPSAALEARAAVDDGLTNLLLALATVVLLVGGLGVANVMAIAVVQRTGEIGLRRALGATSRQIRTQFLLEAFGYSMTGGFLGVLAGVVATVIVASTQDWEILIPIRELGMTILLSLSCGLMAGSYPASKAARLDPAQAVRSGV